MHGYVGQYEGLRATLYLELVPEDWFPAQGPIHPFFTSETNTLGLTERIFPRTIAATRFKNFKSVIAGC